MQLFTLGLACSFLPVVLGTPPSFRSSRHMLARDDAPNTNADDDISGVWIKGAPTSPDSIMKRSETSEEQTVDIIHQRSGTEGPVIRPRFYEWMRIIDTGGRTVFKMMTARADISKAAATPLGTVAALFNNANNDLYGPNRAGNGYFWSSTFGNLRLIVVGAKTGSEGWDQFKISQFCAWARDNAGAILGASRSGEVELPCGTVVDFNGHYLWNFAVQKI